MKKVSLVFILFMILSINTQAQTIRAATVLACPPVDILVPLTVENFINVESFTFGLTYNSIHLQYNGFQNLHPGATGVFMANNSWLDPNYNKFLVACVSSVGTMSIPDGDTLLELSFHYLSDSSNLVWDSFYSCCFTTMVNGMVMPSPTTINQQPGDQTVMSGAAAFFQVVPPFPSAVQYEWQESTNGGNTWNTLINNPPYNGVSTYFLSIDPVTATMNGDLYRCSLTGCSAFTSAVASLTVISNPSVSGNLSYLNLQSSPLPYAQITLSQNGMPVFSSNTDAAGNYQFNNLLPGVYDLGVECIQPWGGGAATDALMVLRHFTGMITLTGLPAIVADVNNSGFINSVDALLILQRFVGLVSSFPAGDWKFDQSSVIIPATGPQTLNIKALCTGDCNCSYQP